MTAGDAKFVSVYETYYRHVYAYCRRRTGPDRVDDAVAEVFLIAWRRIVELPDGEACLPWLYRVAYRVVGHQFRAASRRNQLTRKLAAIGVEATTPTDDYLVQRQESRQVIDALDRLRIPDQEILKLSIWEELPHPEIADILDISVDAAKQRLSRARKRLAREYHRLEKRHVKSPAAQKGGAW